MYFDMTICPKCGKLVHTSPGYCQFCGTNLVETILPINPQNEQPRMSQDTGLHLCWDSSDYVVEIAA